MSAILVDSAFLSKEDSRRLECKYDLFGHDSYMYLNCDDFEAVFTFTELTGAVITSYLMFLYEQIKKEQIHDRGICFMNPSVILRADQRKPKPKPKPKPKHIEDASRAVADRLYKRKGNDIILLPYNPGNHWLLAVLNLKTTTCYYLDSLRLRSVDEQLRQIIDTAMAVYASESGANIRVKLVWINARCPRQPGGTECGYYVMKFMKEIAHEGVEILDNDNVSLGIF
ncbi:putative Ulp1 protease family catalytic domain, papain-like cysteine peptidase superfamily [Helianthus anomalus]